MPMTTTHDSHCYSSRGPPLPPSPPALPLLQGVVEDTGGEVHSIVDEATVLLSCSSYSLAPPSPTGQTAAAEAAAEAEAAREEEEEEAVAATTAAAAEAAMTVCLGAVFCLEAPGSLPPKTPPQPPNPGHLGHWHPRHRSRRCKRWSQPA